MIIKNMNKIFRIATMQRPSMESEIDKLIQFASIKIPKEYLDIIKKGTDIEICVNNEKYIRIWGALGCIEMNEAYYIQKYIPDSLAIGDDEGGYALIYVNGYKGFGLYMVAFNELDYSELKYVSASLLDLLVYAKGVEVIRFPY